MLTVNCISLGNASGTKGSGTTGVKQQPFSDFFATQGPMNCHKSLARSYLGKGTSAMGGFDTPQVDDG